MDARDGVNLVITAAWVFAAVACWLQPRVARNRLAAGKTSRAPVAQDLRLASAATCATLAVASFAAIPIAHGNLPGLVGQALSALAAVGLGVTLVILLRERLARGR